MLVAGKEVLKRAGEEWSDEETVVEKLGMLKITLVDRPWAKQGGVN